jgi:hypothetical protein
MRSTQRPHQGWEENRDHIRNREENTSTIRDGEENRGLSRQGENRGNSRDEE